MTIEYPRRFPKTRRQLLWQCVVSALILLPPLVWRFTSERARGLQWPWAASRWWRLRCSYRGLRFLATQEQQHPQPTPEMTFVFMLVAIYPLAMSMFLLILLAEM